MYLFCLFLQCTGFLSIVNPHLSFVITVIHIGILFIFCSHFNVYITPYTWGTSYASARGQCVESFVCFFLYINRNSSTNWIQNLGVVTTRCDLRWYSNILQEYQTWCLFRLKVCFLHKLEFAYLNRCAEFLSTYNNVYYSLLA